MAMSDQNGEVHASIPGLARIAGIDIQSVEKALDAFMSPDAYSRTPDNEGRRVAKIDGGWELLNHAKYRMMASKEDSKAASAARVKRHRDRNASVTPCNALVTPCNGDVTVRRYIAEAEAEADTKKEIPPNPQGGISRPKRKKSNPKHERVTENTPAMIQINDWFGRRPDTLWTIEQARILELINPSEAVLNGMGNFYLADETPESPLFRRTTLTTLLNNWDDELDKARAYARKNNQ